MTIAVTAASGKLGSEIVRTLKLVEPGEEVIGLARTPERANTLGVEIRPGDYGERDQLEASLKGVDIVLLVSGMDEPDKRIVQHRNVLAAAKSAGVRKLVYTSIQGPADETGFSPVVSSNRQTEEDVRASGVEWVIGRNGVYIEPDIEYIDQYREQGEIANSAGSGRCGYTTRRELANAYARLLVEPTFNGQTFYLNGPPITQDELAGFLNKAFGTTLTYRAIPSAKYEEDRIRDLGPFIGKVIAGIYDGIRLGAFDKPGDFETVVGRPHQSWHEFFSSLRD